MKYRTKNKCVISSFLIVAIIFIVLGSILYIGIKSAVIAGVKEKVVIKNGSDSFDNWVSPTVPVYMKFVLFDVINSVDVITNNSKPIVKERGPYVYREIRDKENINFTANGNKVSYLQPKGYVFEPRLSKGTENDTLMTINLFAVTAAQQLYDKINNNTQSSVLRKSLYFIVREAFSTFGETVFHKHTVHDVLWGYDDHMLIEINKLVSKIGLHINTTVGLFSGPTANMTNDGEYVVNTGKSNIHKLNMIEEWRGEPTLDFWDTPYGNMLNGTDGTEWHPNVKKHENLQIFSSDICRSMNFKYVKNEKLKGIDMYRFSPPKSVLESGDNNPDNKCFCKGKCLKDGALDLSICRQGAPIAVSMPHFYQGSEDYVDAIDGMNPVANLHQTFIDVEPITGLAMNAAKRLQINMRLNPIPTLKGLKVFSNDTLFPVLWLEEAATIDSKTADDYNKEIGDNLHTVFIMGFVFIAGGIILMFVFIGLWRYFLKNGRTPIFKQLDNEPEELDASA